MRPLTTRKPLKLTLECGLKPGRSAEDCKHFKLFAPYGSIGVLASAQMIFITRMYAIWNQNLIVLGALL